MSLFVDDPNPKIPDRLSDGGGLFIYRSMSGSVTYTFMYMRLKKRHVIGLGRTADVKLAEARIVAAEYRNLLARNIDPLLHKRLTQNPATFLDAANDHFNAFSPTLKNDRQRATLKRLIDVDCKPLHRVPIATLEIEHVLQTIDPLESKPAIRKMTLSLIRRVIDRAAAKGKRNPNLNNPASPNLIRQIVPLTHKATNHPALPYADAPAFFKTLTNPANRQPTPAERALALIMLTGLRKMECLTLTHQALDLNPTNPTITIPAERMKTKKAHVVPLTAPALAILKSLNRSPSSQYVFAGRNDPTTHLSPVAFNHLSVLSKFTVHGMRSTLTDWLADETDTDHAVREAILAHQIPSSTERAYRRSTALNKRRHALTLWSQYLTA